MKKVEYVAGFLFNKDGSQVILIKKNRPDWQRGSLNGVGGHIEANESPVEAMAREFLEESGVPVDEEEWRYFATLHGQSDVEWAVHFFYAFNDFCFTTALDMPPQTDEWLGGYQVRNLTSLKTIPNLCWLVPMALSMRFETAERFTVTEHYTTSPKG